MISFIFSKHYLRPLLIFTHFDKKNNVAKSHVIFAADLRQTRNSGWRPTGTLSVQTRNLATFFPKNTVSSNGIFKSIRNDECRQIEANKNTLFSTNLIVSDHADMNFYWVVWDGLSKKWLYKVGLYDVNLNLTLHWNIWKIGEQKVNFFF